MSPYILHLECSTADCSAAISKGEELIAFLEKSKEESHTENVHTLILEVLKSVSIDLKTLDAVAVGSGPGSYTGLRVAAASAKGICFALRKPLIAIPTLKMLAHAHKPDAECYVIPVLDARSMGVFAEVYDSSCNQVKDTFRVVVDKDTFRSYYESAKCIFIGTGAAKCEAVINSPNAVFIRTSPSSKHMVKLAYQQFLENHFENISDYEPFYVKDFI